MTNERRWGGEYLQNPKCPKASKKGGGRKADVVLPQTELQILDALLSRGTVLKMPGMRRLCGKAVFAGESEVRPPHPDNTRPTQR